MRYHWYITTMKRRYAGTDATVFLSLAGLDSVMKELEIGDPDDGNDWEEGETNHGTVETEELGELQTGTLRTDNSGTGSGWDVESVRIVHEEDGREWTATLNRGDDNGRFPMLRFQRTSDGQYAQLEAQKKRKADAQARKSEKDRQSDEDKAEADRLEREMEQADREMERELKRARQQAELNRKRAELDKVTGKSTPPAGGGSGGGGGGSGAGSFRTYELFGVLNGANVPLIQVVLCDRNTGRCSVVAGGRVMVGEVPTDGFGLAGTPGRWPVIYGGQSPAAFGLDADKAVMGWDGSRGWVLKAEFLAQILGAGWRSAIYS